MSKVSAGRAAGARGDGPEAAGFRGPRARRCVACGQPALERGDDQGEGGARPCSRRFPPGPSPGPASGRTIRGWAGSAPTAGPPRSAGRGRGHLAGRGRRAGKVPWGAPGRFLPGLPALPPPRPALPGLRPRLRPLRRTRAPCGLGFPPGPSQREASSSPPFLGENPRPGASALLTAGMPGPGGAPTIRAAAAGFLGGARQPVPLEVILKVTQEVGVGRGEDPGLPRRRGVPRSQPHSAGSRVKVTPQVRGTGKGRPSGPRGLGTNSPPGNLTRKTPFFLFFIFPVEFDPLSPLW